MNNQEVSKPSAEGADKEKSPPNVILITLDAFRYDLFLENLDELPNLKELKSQSVFFENAFSVGPATFFAFPAIIASVYPYHFGVGVTEAVKAIDGVLKDQGYNTAQVNECNVLLTPYFGYGTNTDYQNHILNLSDAEEHRRIHDTLLRRGGAGRARPDLIRPLALQGIGPKLRFIWRRSRLVTRLGVYFVSLFRFLVLYRRMKPIERERRDMLYRRFRGEVLQFISGRFETPQFLWVHTVLNHLPYFPPENCSVFDTREVNYLNCRGISRFVNRETCNRLKGLYVESLKVTDGFVGDVVDALRMNGLLDNSIIVVTSDHGEEFMEEGHFGHLSEASSDILLHVPLIFYCPNILQPKRISAPVSTIDILPTICGLLGIRIPGSSRGLSLKDIMLNLSEGSGEYRELWQRPLFSEAWETKGPLDRGTGPESNRRIFTVRKGLYKLRVVQEQENENRVVEKLELVNWVSNERLDVRSNSQIVEHLKQLLDNHIYDEGVFARQIGNEAERLRIKDALSRVRNKLQS